MSIGMVYQTKLLNCSSVYLIVGNKTADHASVPVTGKKRKGLNKSTRSSKSFDTNPYEHVDHVIMNLPASALQFLGKVLHVFSPFYSNMHVYKHKEISLCIGCTNVDHLV